MRNRDQVMLISIWILAAFSFWQVALAYFLILSFIIEYYFLKQRRIFCVGKVERLQVLRDLNIIRFSIALAVVLIYLIENTGLRGNKIPSRILLYWFGFQTLFVSIGLIITFVRSQPPDCNDQKMLFEVLRDINALSTYVSASLPHLTLNHSIEFISHKIVFLPLESLWVSSNSLKFVPDFLLTESWGENKLVAFISPKLIPTFFRKATSFNKVKTLIIPEFPGIVEFLRRNRIREGFSFLRGEHTIDYGIWWIPFRNLKVKTVTFELQKIISEENKTIPEVLEEYYELHREEIEGQVADLKEELRQTIRRYEGKRLWLRGKSRLWLESKKYFLAELDKEYPEL
ncbi:MAG: hypothetical protein D6732_20980 [Methanobacteriota archaeon]|nr:MAG: hypothetical protein D6732_20980 [Euryarchaeota archaeon]